MRDDLLEDDISDEESSMADQGKGLKYEYEKIVMI
jgi:hypothetical protein